MSRLAKRCSDCDAVKPITEFPKDIGKPDGYQGACKKCKNLKSKEWRHTHPEEARAMAKRSRERNRDKISVRSKRWAQANPKKLAINLRKSRTLHLLEDKARHAVDYAVRLGKLAPIKTRKCKHCDRQAEHYHHHKGYQKEHWLDVEPVCRRCHVVIENGK